MSAELAPDLQEKLEELERELEVRLVGLRDVRIQRQTANCPCLS